MVEPLFRPEVMAGRLGARFGPAVFYQPPTVKLMVLFLVMVFASFLVFAANASLTQTERVRGYLTSTAGEVKIYGGRPGVLTDVFVEDGDTVTAGQVLMALSDPQYDHLGQQKAAIALQQIDAQLQQLARRKDIVASRFEFQEEQLRQQLEGMQQTLQLLREEQKMRQQRVDLSRNDLEASRKLHASNTISDREYRQVASSQFLLQQQAKTGDLAIARHLQAMVDTRQKLLILPLRAQEEALVLASSESQLYTRRHDLLAQLRFSITATRDGIVDNVVSRQGDIINTSEPLLTLLHSGSELEAWLYLPSRALTDIDAGAHIKISYDAYPHETYGTFPAQVFSVADSAIDPREFLFPIDIREPVYLVKARLADQGFAEGAGNRFRPGMQFTADIVTGKQTVLETILSPLRGLRRRL